MKAKIIYFIIIFFQISYALKCGNNCPSNLCRRCVCSSKKPAILNETQLKDLCSSFQEWNQTCCTCIASTLSHNNTRFMTQDSEKKLHVGLWQISEDNWSSCNNGNPPCAKDSNLKCAIENWRNGNNSFALWPNKTVKKCNCARSLSSLLNETVNNLTSIIQQNALNDLSEANQTIKNISSNISRDSVAAVSVALADILTNLENVNTNLVHLHKNII